MFVIFGLLLVVYQCSSADLSSEYKNNVKLDDTYMLYWTFNKSEAAMYFALKAQTMGWVGFGFANKIDNMKGYDVAVGYVTPSKKSFELRVCIHIWYSFSVRNFEYKTSVTLCENKIPPCVLKNYCIFLLEALFLILCRGSIEH